MQFTLQRKFSVIILKVFLIFTSVGNFTKWRGYTRQWAGSQWLILAMVWGMFVFKLLPGAMLNHCQLKQYSKMSIEYQNIFKEMHFEMTIKQRPFPFISHWRLYGHCYLVALSLTFPYPVTSLGMRKGRTFNWTNLLDFIILIAIDWPSIRYPRWWFTFEIKCPAGANHSLKNWCPILLYNLCVVWLRIVNYTWLLIC